MVNMQLEPKTQNEIDVYNQCVLLEAALTGKGFLADIIREDMTIEEAEDIALEGAKLGFWE